MSFYREQVLPRVQERIMNRATAEVRARVCSGLWGEVIEIGFGTGLNVAHYPQELTRVSIIEPSRVCMKIAAARIERSPVPVQAAGLDGERLDFPSESFDAALSTWTLCTIPDLVAALAELRRVLRPGGALHFVEHGYAPDPGVNRWQRRMEPLNKRLFGGCHLTRHISDEIERAGFSIEVLETYYSPGEPKVSGYTYEGHAAKA